LELKSDNRFFLCQGKDNFAGKYDLDKQTLTLIFDGGRAIRFETKDTLLLDPQSTPWTYWRGGESGLSYEKTIRTGLLKNKERQDKRDILINDLNNIAALAFQYRIRPTSMGGGGNSYRNFTIPVRMAYTDYATYSAVAKKDSIQFVACLVSDPKSGIVVSIDPDARLCNWKYQGELQ
jgi:hypothetical protein